MVIGTIVKPTKKIAYWWTYKLGIVVKIDTSSLSRCYTHMIFWDNGKRSYEKPSSLEAVKA